jgi:hypothetical protein
MQRRERDRRVCRIEDTAPEQAAARSAPTLGALLARYARAGTLREDITDRPWTERPLDIEPG